jgi:hypothetical protein
VCGMYHGEFGGEYGGGKVGVGDMNGQRMSCRNGVVTHEGTGSGLGEGTLVGPCPSCQMIVPPIFRERGAKV